MSNDLRLDLLTDAITRSGAAMQVGAQRAAAATTTAAPAADDTTTIPPATHFRQINGPRPKRQTKEAP